MKEGGGESSRRRAGDLWESTPLITNPTFSQLIAMMGNFWLEWAINVIFILVIYLRHRHTVASLAHTSLFYRQISGCTFIVQSGISRAALGAKSFPGIPTCPGILTKVNCTQ